MLSILERLASPAFAVPLAVIALYSIYSRLGARASIASGLPWVGKGANGVFSHTAATVLSLTNLQQWMAEGYKAVRVSTVGRLTLLTDNQM